MVHQRHLTEAVSYQGRGAVLRAVTNEGFDQVDLTNHVGKLSHNQLELGFRDVPALHAPVLPTIRAWKNSHDHLRLQISGFSIQSR